MDGRKGTDHGNCPFVRLCVCLPVSHLTVSCDQESSGKAVLCLNVCFIIYSFGDCVAVIVVFMLCFCLCSWFLLFKLLLCIVLSFLARSAFFHTFV